MKRDAHALAHAVEDCVGAWRLAGTGRTRWIRCTHCYAEHEGSPEFRRAAIEENRAGLVLRRLAAEGVARGGQRRG
jgi:hypothetical protein